MSNVIAAALLAAGCATAPVPLEGKQEAAWDRFKTCQAEAPSVKLVRIDPDRNRFWYQGNSHDMSVMRECLARVKQR